MKSFKLKLIILFILLLGAVFSFYAAWREERSGILTVAFLDVGQGDAIYIESPSGNQVLIDAGSSKAVLRELGKVMPFYDHSIDVVLASHADQDHIGGLPDVIGKYKVNLFLESGVSASTSSYMELEAQIERLKIKRLEIKKGMEVDLGGGVILQILSPTSVFPGMETNNASVVARLVYGESEFLFTGDAPTGIENYLVLESQGRTFGTGAVQGPTLASNVLKVAHHGSKNSDSSEFVSAVAPEYAVISVGKDNKYGHPNKEVLDTFTNFGTQILRTDESGTIIFKSDGTNLTPPR